MTLLAEIETRLRAAFSPTHFELLDESHQHAGHAGAQGGGQHFALTMRSAVFAGVLTVKRHQMVYAALQDLMIDEPMLDEPSATRQRIGYIHALKLQLQP